MKPFYLLPLALFGAAIATPLAAQAPARTVIHAGQLLAEPGKPARGASTIIVEGGRIVSIADGYQPAEPGATLIDLKDKYVLPGLIDSHVHLTSDAGGIAGQLEEITLRSEEHTSELQSLMRISYAVFCLTQKKTKQPTNKVAR